MQNFIFISLKIASVFLAISLGVILRLWRQHKINIDTISELILYLGVPCLIFTKLARSNYQWSELGLLSSSMLLIFAGTGLLAFIYIKIFKPKSGNLLYLSTMFMNTANMGYPVTLFTLGQAAFQKAIILDLTMVVTIFSVGIGIISKKYFEWTKIPVIYAAFLGLLFSKLHIILPNIIYEPLALIGQLAVPLMLISLGCKLADIKKVKKILFPVVATLIRSLGGFLVGVLAVSLFKITGITRDVILLYAALPAPVISYVLAQKYHQEEILAAEIVFVSNLSALIILPIIIYLIKYII